MRGRTAINSNGLGGPGQTGGSPFLYGIAHFRGLFNRRGAKYAEGAINLDQITHLAIGAGIVVHRELGPGLLESAYEACLHFELASRGLRIERQKQLPLVYKGVKLNCGYRLDLVIENAVIIELKAVDALGPIHDAQMLTHLKLSGCTVGLIMNFNVPILKMGFVDL